MKKYIFNFTGKMSVRKNSVYNQSVNHNKRNRMVKQVPIKTNNSVDTSRRRFIFGTGSAVAACSLPFFSLATQETKASTGNVFWSSSHIQIGLNGELVDVLPLPTPIHLYHLGNGSRTYQPNLSRFLSMDSYGPFSIAGINPYAYCSGDPINFKDPTGNLSTQAWIGIGLGVLGLTLSVITLGAGAFAASALISAGAAASSYAIAATSLSIASSTLGVVSASTGIASAALSDSDPETAATLSWVSFGFGIGSIVTGMGSYTAGRMAYSGYSSALSVTIGESPSRLMMGGLSVNSSRISGHGYPFNAIAKFSGEHSVSGIQLGKIMSSQISGSKDITLTICFGGRLSSAQLLANQTGQTVHAAKGFHRIISTATDINTIYRPLTGSARMLSNTAGSGISHLTRSSIQNSATLYRTPVLAAQSPFIDNR